MSKHRSTYEMAAPHIGAYVQPLWPGAIAMPFDLHDETGRRISMGDDHLSGRHLVLVFLDDTSDDAALPLLKAFAERYEEIERLSASVVAISASSDAARNRAIKSASGFPWPIAGDATGAVFASYGLHKDNDASARVVLLTPLRQVRAWFDAPKDSNNTVNTIMDVLDGSQAAEEMRWSAPHAPILLVPNVLTAEECGSVIESFEKGGPFMVRPPREGEVAGDYKMPVYEHNRQDRVDQIVRDPQMTTFLDERIWGRVTPMIKKAFAFDVTRREDFHIARYAGAREGNQMGHRDNTSAATAYRRFALSMSLNDDYEGGEIVFREYSPRGYRPPAGTAMVFSSSLLHEVQETTEGVRYNLISHFFNEDSLRR